MAISNINDAIEALAEVTSENRDRIKQSSNQRRNQVVDVYGTEYTRQGDANNPADFFISISPDLVYLERFQFKVYVQPFAVPIKTDNHAIGSTSLSVSSEDGKTPSTHRHTISPNPHTHSIQSGITLQSSEEATDWKIYIGDTSDTEDERLINITSYLRLQAENMPHGRWISGETGIYPSVDLEGRSISGSFDLIAVANDLYAEGRYSDVDKVLNAGFKRLRIKSNAPFQVSILLYMKYSHLNR